MISCQFCKIFKNTFFIEHLRWLLLAILKPVDSQRQLCKWISKLVTIYFISTFCWDFVFIFDKHKLSFYILMVLWLRKYDGFDFSRDHGTEVSRDFLGGASLSWFSTLQSFGSRGLCQCRDKTFWLDTWPRDPCVTWLCRCHHPAKFGVHRPCEKGSKTFFICQVTTILKCHVTLWFGFSHPKSPIG